MSKTLFLLDPGHGGMIDGKYQTAGKRSPLFDDGVTVLYEGVNNRDNVNRIMAASDNLNLHCVDIVNSQEDISLTDRVNRANKLYRDNKNCLYISVHSDAAGNDWSDAKGISVYTSQGQTKSDVFASILVDELESAFGSSVKFRKDLTDKDEDKEAAFYVLEKTAMPAVLIEAGFHTNKEEAEAMLKEDWKNKLTSAVTNAMMKWEKLNQIQVNASK
jgi:N-acetylmuramoyl-L-alanine amidase